MKRKVVASSRLCVCVCVCVCVQAAANRAERPWIIVSGHRAIYSPINCDANGNPIKDSLNLQVAIEDLLHKYEVDLYFGGTIASLTAGSTARCSESWLCDCSGHFHSYHRCYPVYKNQVRVGPSRLLSAVLCRVLKAAGAHVLAFRIPQT
jgi:hypothetical protein